MLVGSWGRYAGMLVGQNSWGRVGRYVGGSTIWGRYVGWSKQLG